MTHQRDQTVAAKVAKPLASLDRWQASAPAGPLRPSGAGGSQTAVGAELIHISPTFQDTLQVHDNTVGPMSLSLRKPCKVVLCDVSLGAAT
jgi:hypothetical protein